MRRYRKEGEGVSISLFWQVKTSTLETPPLTAPFVESEGGFLITTSLEIKKKEMGQEDE